MQLLAAPMLFGLVLASVPIIIHLWNKRRFQLIEWAPMRYLKLTIKTNRRRMRIEQILLLVVRTLVILLLFMALARPAMSRAGLGGWLASRARASRIIVLDDSLSMGYQAGAHSAFDSAKEAVAQIIRTIGSRDSVTLLASSRPGQPLVREVSLQDPSRLLKDVSGLSLADSACDWSALLKRLDEYVSGAAHPQKEIVLITDMRRSGWNAGVSAQASKWAGQSIDVKIVDVGSRQTENVSLLRFEQEDPIALPGAPLKLKASVRNDSPAAVRGAQAALEIDGQSRPLVLPDLQAGQTTELPLTITLSKTGQHVVRLSMPADSLSADNVRWLAVNVRSEIRILMIDGQIGSRAFESSTDFLQVAMTAGVEPWQVTRRTDAEWQRAAAAVSDPQLAGADVIVVSNLATLTPQQVGVLEQLVSSGTGLMIFGGEQLDPALYERLLHRDGAGLLPGRLARTLDGPANGVVVESLGDSPLAPLSKIAPEALTRIRPKRFLSVSLNPAQDHDARVLARWNDSESHAAVVEKRFGRGRVILWTMSADRQWSDWPVDPTYVLAVRSAALAIARPDPVGTNFTAGQEIAYPFEPGQVVRNPMVANPAGTVPQSVVLDNQILRFGDTSHAGKYQITWKDVRDAEQSRWLCASFDAVESNLEPIADSEIEQLLAPLRPQIIHWSAAGSDESLTQKGREIWRNVVTAVLALAAFEAALAMWVGRER